MFISVASERATESKATAIELSIARSKADLEEAFSLVYASYVRAGLQQPNDIGLRLVRYHLLTSTEVMVARLHGTTISTASLIVDSELGLPAESMYHEEIEAVRRRGLKLAEVGCLADRRESPARFIQMFRQLATLIAQAARVRGCHGLIAATHPRHARFYIRQLGFKRIGEIRDCPYVQGNPAVPMLLDFHAIRGTDLHRHLFAENYSDAELAPFEWDTETRSYFQSVLERIGESPLNRGKNG